MRVHRTNNETSREMERYARHRPVQTIIMSFFFFKQKTAYEIGLGIPAEPLFRSKLSLLPKKLFRIRMSRNFGMKMLTMTNLSTECLIQLTKLGYDATPFNQILKQNAKREMRLRLGKHSFLLNRSSDQIGRASCRE